MTVNASPEVVNYNAQLAAENQEICTILMVEILENLPNSTNKVWHGSPVWFIDDNPIVGYSKLKDCIQLLQWDYKNIAKRKGQLGYLSSEIQHKIQEL